LQFLTTKLPLQEVDGEILEECSDKDNQIAILEYDTRDITPYGVRILFKNIEKPSSAYWGYTISVDGVSDGDGWFHKPLSTTSVLHDTFGPEGHLIAFKSVSTEPMGNASDDQLKSLGEIKV
jgi:hypothetical protein